MSLHLYVLRQFFVGLGGYVLQSIDVLFASCTSVVSLVWIVVFVAVGQYCHVTRILSSIRLAIWLNPMVGGVCLSVGFVRL